jgi:hypothetical protein
VGGCPLLLAGSEAVLAELPAGNWIGGTIPYFMDANGGTCSESKIFVTPIPRDATSVQVIEYTARELPNICRDAPDNGFSVIIMPAESTVHSVYAQNAPEYEGMYLKPIVGWISGVHLSALGKQRPKVFNGLTGQASTECAVVMHVALPAWRQAEIDILNVFEPGSGSTITFPVAGFTATDCNVDGRPANFAQYISAAQPDLHLPLTADYNGTVVNVSIQSVDPANRIVKFYAPVFPGIEYRFARPVQDYVAAFDSAMRARDNTQATFACNCILNYLYAGLEGKKTGDITGPITFGEVAHQLLNQTMVRLLVRDSDPIAGSSAATDRTGIA